MSMSMPSGQRVVKSFGMSAGSLPAVGGASGSGSLPAMPGVKPSREASASKRRSPNGKLPTLESKGSSNSGHLPSINGGRNLRHTESVQIEDLPRAPKKRQLKSLDAGGGGGDNSNQQSEKAEKAKRRQLRKAEEKKMVKDQVAVAVKAVREVFATPKGKNILELETKVHNAARNDDYAVCKVKRKNDTDSLGISFTIPARVMALGWESGQHLVVTDTTKKPGVKSTLEIRDIVVAVDEQDVHSIEDLKRCVASKKKMYFKCIRNSQPITEEELAETQQRIETALKAAVKAKVKASIRARRKRAE